jgi:hypothetical protein
VCVTEQSASVRQGALPHSESDLVSRAGRGGRGSFILRLLRRELRTASCQHATALH